MRRSKDGRDRHPCYSCDDDCRLFEFSLFDPVVASSTDLLGLVCRKADKKKKKMSTTDAVAIFAEGTFEDQVRDV
jgi:hypothetical protein